MISATIQDDKSNIPFVQKTGVDKGTVTVSLNNEIEGTIKYDKNGGLSYNWPSLAASKSGGSRCPDKHGNWIGELYSDSLSHKFIIKVGAEGEQDSLFQVTGIDLHENKYVNKAFSQFRETGILPNENDITFE